MADFSSQQPTFESFSDLPDSIRPIFAAAGWKQGRRVAVLSLVPREHPAYAILAEFGGLSLGVDGAGQECATSALKFEHIETNRVISLWAELLRTRLVGIAEVSHGHADLYVDETGRVFFASQVHDAFALEGASFREALERLLLGMRSRPMLRPDQSEVMMWGEKYLRGDPRVYEYR